MGPTFRESMVNPSKTEKSPDLTHYFSKLAQFNKIKNKFEKVTSRGTWPQSPLPFTAPLVGGVPTPSLFKTGGRPPPGNFVFVLEY